MHTIDTRLVFALVAAIAGGFVPLGPVSGILPHLLVGAIVAGLTFVVPLMRTLLAIDAAATREHVDGEDPGRTVSDLIVLTVGLMGLAGVGVLLVDTGTTGDVAADAVGSVIALLTVAVGWLSVHAIYITRYARIYYSSPTPCIDFKQDADPRYSDFAYFSFNLGMTYQVSDNDLRDSNIRRVVLGHCLLAYVFGMVIIASTINLVVGLGSR